MPTALIADDEPNLAAELASRLAKYWPELEIVAMPRNFAPTAFGTSSAVEEPVFAVLTLRVSRALKRRTAGAASSLRFATLPYLED